MKLLVNIRGANGAGKSTIPMSMMDDLKMKVIGIGPNNTRPYITVFPSYMWVALGTYHNKTGGLDSYKNNAETHQAMMYCLINYPDYDILMEGIIASTVKSTYARWFSEIEQEMVEGKLYERRILVMSFLPPLDVCLERVYERNGGKPIKEEQVASKWRTVDRNVQYFKDEGFISLRINNARCPKEKMLVKFLETCDKYR